MAEDYVTIDFDSLLTDEQLLQLEEEANRAVYRNIRVISSIVTCDELDAIPLAQACGGATGRYKACKYCWDRFMHMLRYAHALIPAR